jgi:hypothetical protein
MKSLTKIAAIVAAVMIVGCASTPRKPLNPPTASINGKLVSGTLTAMCDDPDECKSFDLTLNNLTEDTLEIDWNRSYYLNNGRPDGGLYFNGIVITQRNNPRSPDVILPKSTFHRNLVPNKHFSLSMFPLAHWTISEFEGDSHGTYITLRSGGKEEIVNVSVNINRK